LSQEKNAYIIKELITANESGFQEKLHDLCLNFRTIYGGLEPCRNRVVVPARQAIRPGGIGSLESIFGLLKSLKIRALSTVANGRLRIAQ